MSKTNTATALRSTEKPKVTREQRRRITELHTRIYVTERKKRGLGSLEETFRVNCGPKPCSLKRTCREHKQLFEQQRPAERLAQEDYRNGIAHILGRVSEPSGPGAGGPIEPLPVRLMSMIRQQGPVGWSEDTPWQKFPRIPLDDLELLFERELIRSAIRITDGTLRAVADCIEVRPSTLQLILKTRHLDLSKEFKDAGTFKLLSWRQFYAEPLTGSMSLT
jgi:hypothetical protein